jgi:hypothetical protein
MPTFASAAVGQKQPTAVTFQFFAAGKVTDRYGSDKLSGVVAY